MHTKGSCSVNKLKVKARQFKLDESQNYRRGSVMDRCKGKLPTKYELHVGTLPTKCTAVIICHAGIFRE
jgi:hypothetical protein